MKDRSNKKTCYLISLNFRDICLINSLATFHNKCMQRSLWNLQASDLYPLIALTVFMSKWKELWNIKCCVFYTTWHFPFRKKSFIARWYIRYVRRYAPQSSFHLPLQNKYWLYLLPCRYFKIVYIHALGCWFFCWSINIFLVLIIKHFLCISCLNDTIE